MFKLALFPLAAGIVYLFQQYRVSPLHRDTEEPSQASSSHDSKGRSVNARPSVPEIDWSIKKGEQFNPAALTALVDKANAILAVTPDSLEALTMRGNAYAEKRQWALAKADYAKVLKLNPGDYQIKFNLAELQFRRKDYDRARPGFEALRGEPEVGDLATYKVFLCDLFGGHENVAREELADANRVGKNPSYYFENAAWHLYHNNAEAARPWLNSAASIYFPAKFDLYASSLVSLGYLPLPASP